MTRKIKKQTNKELYKFAKRIFFYFFCICLLIQCRLYSKSEFLLYSNSCSCDSMSVIDYESMYFDADSNIVAPMKKIDFKYYFEVSEISVNIDNNEYFPFICGLNKIDSVGYLRFSDSCVFYRSNINGYDEVLFDKKAKVGDEWNIKNGVLADYKIIMNALVKSKIDDDCIYVYNFVYLGPKVSHGYYYKKLIISDKSGFLKLSFTNKINCFTNKGRQILY